MKRIFALILSFALLLSCLVLPAGAMFDPSPVYQVQAQSAQRLLRQPEIRQHNIRFFLRLRRKDQ